MRPVSLLLLSTISCVAVCASATAQTAVGRKAHFTFTTAAGKLDSARVVTSYYQAPQDRRIDPRMVRAASIADERAHANSRRRCWRSVKEALVASGAISSYPQTQYAREAGQELVRNFGFTRLSISDPYAAPVGSVLVYDKGANRPGHVELRTKTGFASDFRANTPDRHPLLGVYAKSS